MTLLKNLQPFLLLCLFAITVLSGYMLTKSADVEEVEVTKENKPRKIAENRLPENKPLSRTNIQREKKKTILAPAPSDAIPNELLIRFDNDADYQAFLASMKARGLSFLGSSDKLRAVRFGFGANSNLDGLKNDQLAYNFIVTPPIPPDVSAQEGAVGFGRNALSWLGVTGDNSNWGKGVLVAVIDSGVNDHIALNKGNGLLSFLNLTELSAGVDQLGHGTAVASIISGDLSQTQGVAPASDILSIRITDETGISDSFTLAEGIIQATLAGADIINISMGSASSSLIVSEAIAFAQEQGAVIVASAGNDGQNQLASPAADDGVISVGAIEAEGNHVDFSHTSEDLDIVAPGYGVNAAWGEDLQISFSGTSASAPYVSGAIAATMSEFPELSATEAANVVLTHSNDGGLPGRDDSYGGGILALDRIMDKNTPGIYDAAVAGQVLSNDSSSIQALITIQNQGTEVLINSPVKISSPNGIENVNISSLLPGHIHTISLPLPTSTGNIAVTTSVETTENDNDTSNNSRSVNFEVE